MLAADQFEMAGQGLLSRGGQHGHPVLIPLAGADEDLVLMKVQVLNAQAAAFEEPQAGSVE